MSVKPITVANPSFALDLQARDCPPLQFVREFTVNGLEAVAARRTSSHPNPAADQVVWRRFHELGDDVAPKLCCIDTGTGMTPEDLDRYIGAIASSGKVQAADANYGMGAKIAGAAHSPAGLTYLSWTGSEQGWTCTLVRDPQRGWGLQEAIPGQYLMQVPAHLCPVEIQQAGWRGTVVVLHGQGPDHDTTQPVAGLGVDWLMQTINARFLELPDDVEVRCQRPGETDRRRARGHLAHLATYVEDQGVVTLSDCDVRWFVLADDHDKRKKNGGRHVSIGHRAAVHRGEIYDMKTIAAGGFRSLQTFGIHTGFQRVALLIEPMGASTDQARGRLLLDDEPLDKTLPWDRWGDEFAVDMPQPLRDLVAQSAGQSARRDRRELMRRLAELDAAMPMPAYVPDEHGDEQATPPTHSNTRTDKPARAGDSGRTGTEAGPKHGGSVVSLFTRDDGEQARRQDGQIPEIEPEWLSRADGNRPDGMLDDLAATFLVRQARVQLSKDFRGFRVLVDHFTAQFAHVPGAAAIVEQEVQAACEDQVIEFIVGVLRVRCEPHWDTGRVEKALSDEALTGCLMQHVSLGEHLSERLNRRLRKATAGRVAA